LTDRLRRLPAVSAVLAHPAIAALLEQLPRPVVTKAVQDAIAILRGRLLEGGQDAPDADLLTAAAAEATRLATERGAPSLRRVINATGIVLHTNLGRALLAPEALAAAAEAAARPSTLEYNLADGSRGSRHDHLTQRLTMLSGADDGFAVNNNAAAVLLMLNTLADGREVVVSRGELVEIGGSFRIPEVMQKSGAKLVEVGTTNRTHPEDYRRAITPATALLLKVHTSNYRVVGFTSEVAATDLAALAAEHGLPLMYDLGSGAVYDFARAGLRGEPTLAQAVAGGADVVTASGDKLLGGPQAGIILGRRELLARARRNPLARALRLDKLTIAALQATLDVYLRFADDPAVLARRIPTLDAIMRDPAGLAEDAAQLATALRAIPDGGLTAELVSGESAAGGGSFPGTSFATTLVAVRSERSSAGALAAALRLAPVPVIARVESDVLLLDPRTLTPGDAELVAAAFRHIVGLLDSTG
jgi:L-seryl-tRNA(Ser) seleniumtransferase